MVNGCNNDYERYWKSFSNKHICITGSTGLIGSHIVLRIIEFNRKYNMNCTLHLPVRNKKKAIKLFGLDDRINYYEWDLEKEFPTLNSHIHYVIHAASPTNSLQFEHEPVETILQIIKGLDSVLTACLNVIKPEKIIFLSTMEIYGELSGRISENIFGSLDSMIARNSYPEAKKLSECLCASYFAEYNLPICVVRLAQSFGAGVQIDDKRVFAEFGRAVINKNDIFIYSDGTTRNSYISLHDASNAIAVILAKGQPGLAYNAANESTYTTINDFAAAVVHDFGWPGMQVKHACNPARSRTFRKSKDLNLDTNRLKNLGWRPSDSLMDMFTAMIDDWNQKEF